MTAGFYSKIYNFFKIFSYLSQKSVVFLSLIMLQLEYGILYKKRNFKDVQDIETNKK